MADQRPSVELDVEVEVKPSGLFPAPAENDLLCPAESGGSVQLDDGVLAMATPDRGDQGLQTPIEARPVGHAGPYLVDRSTGAPGNGGCGTSDPQVGARFSRYVDFDRIVACGRRSSADEVDTLRRRSPRHRCPVLEPHDSASQPRPDWGRRG